MHWWQMKMRIENTSKDSFRLINNEWIHSRFDQNVGREVPYVEEDSFFHKNKPLLEPFISPIFNYWAGT